MTKNCESFHHPITFLWVSCWIVLAISTTADAVSGQARADDSESILQWQETSPASETPTFYRPWILQYDSPPSSIIEGPMAHVLASMSPRSKSVPPRTARVSTPKVDHMLRRVQFVESDNDSVGPPRFPGFSLNASSTPSNLQPQPRDSIVFDDPISYEGPSPSTVNDIDARDGPRIPEPMVFDLVRGLGARRGEFEINVLNLVPFKRKRPNYEWAPEVEWVIANGLAIEYELPILDTQIVAQKFAIQYTFGTALDDALIHGVQGIAYFDTVNGDFIPTLLYLIGLRLDERWSLFAMLGGAVGPQAFPFQEEEANPYGTDLIVNLSIFNNVTDRLVLGLETNLSRQLRGPSELLVMPQLHYEIGERFNLQLGFGMRDDVVGRHGELGFRVIWER